MGITRRSKQQEEIARAGQDRAGEARRLGEAETITGSAEHARRLRTALRAASVATAGGDAREIDRAAREVDRAAEPLIAQWYQPLFRYCRRLLQGTPLLRERVEPEDLAQDAWLKMLRYLSEPTGDQIASDKHFQNTLYRAALTLFRDAIDRHERGSATLVQTVALDVPASDNPADAETRGDRLAASSADGWRADRTLILGDDRRSDLIAHLFGDPQAFRADTGGRVRRGLPRYQAYVLLQLGLYLTEELATGTVTDAGELRLLRAYVGELGVPPEWWQAVERAAWDIAADGQEEPDTDEAAVARLLPVVNRVCGVDLKAGKAGNGLAVLKYELNAFAAGDDAKRKERGERK